MTRALIVFAAVLCVGIGWAEWQQNDADSVFA
jgi:hypothetical protein